MSDLNDLINAGIFKQPKAPRDSWKLGVVDGTPAAGVASVLIDGDDTPTSMPHAPTCDDGDRVVVCLLGRSWFVAHNLTPAQPEDWSPALAGSGGMTLSTYTINRGRQRKADGRFRFEFYATCTTAGSASNYITFAVPEVIAGGGAAIINGGGWIYDGSGSAKPCILAYIDATHIGVGWGTNWSIGANRLLNVWGSYEI